MAWRQNNHATPQRDTTGNLVAMRTMPTGSRKGVPDILAIPPGGGVLHGFEIKIGKDRQSSDQIQFMNDLQNRDAVYIVVKEIDDILDFLSGEKVRRLQ